MDQLLKSGVNFIEMRHDAGCPSIHSQSSFDCECDAHLVKLPEKQWLANVNKTRQQRRKAEREAAKAIRKARGMK